LFSSPVLALQPSKTPDAKKVMAEAMTILEKRDYARLEAMLEQYKENGDRIGDGQWKLHLAMDGIDGSAAQFADDAATVERSFSLISDWVTQKPESIMAKTALAHAWLSRAWLYRGKKYSAETSSVQFIAFDSGLENAFKVLKEIGDTQDSNPELYMAWMNLAVAAGLPTEVVDDIHVTATRLYPDYFYISLQYLVTKFERWSGEQDSLPLALKPLAVNSELFARAMWLLVDYGENYKVLGAGYSKIIQEGFTAIKGKYNSAVTTNQIAFLACFQWNDVPSFEKAFSAIGSEPDLTVWKKRDNYNKCINWAGCNKTTANK